MILSYNADVTETAQGEHLTAVSAQSRKNVTDTQRRINNETEMVYDRHPAAVG